MTIEAWIGHSYDFQVATPVVKCDHRIVYNFALEPCTASTLDASLAIKKYQIAQRDVFGAVQLIIKIEPATVLTMTDGEVLQRTFAPFVTDWTIQRMAGQKELDDVPSRVRHFVGVGPDNHSWSDLNCAACL
jgi:hypothetical protein